MSQPTYRLYWLRESASGITCDAGTPTELDQLPASIRDRVAELTASASESGPEFHLRLPFFDRRENRKCEQLLADVPFERTGNLIRAVLPPTAAMRDMAATFALTDPLWRETPSERDAAYFPTWQRVSVALQRWLRDRISAEYFREIEMLQDRPSAYPMIVYQASRIYLGRPRTEFTYDLRDYPWSEDTLAASWKMTGRAVQRVLGGLEARLQEAGQARLAHRYSPVWYEDVRRAVESNAKPYAELLAREAMIVNAVIDLGTYAAADEAAARRSLDGKNCMDALNRCVKNVNQALRKVHGRDLRHLGPGLLEEANRALAQSASPEDFANSGANLIDRWPLKNADVSAARRPDLRVGREEDADDRRANGSGQVRDARVVTNVDAGLREPARQLI
jgi:hypothetical protein